MGRSVEKEKLLDDLTLNGDVLEKTLQGLEWINKWLGNSRSLSKSVLKLCSKSTSKHPVKIIDLGCGAGDLLIRISKELNRKKIPFKMIGVDGNSAVLNYAKSKANQNGLENISFKQANILSDSFRIDDCDILISSHFIYHFADDQLTAFIKENLSKVQLAIIFDELVRNKLAHSLFKFFGSFMPINKGTHQDGLLAIQRAFTKKELKGIIEKSEAKTFSLKSVPFFRQQLIIQTN